MLRDWFERLRVRLMPPPAPSTTGLVLSGGGARGAYQAGVLRYIAEAFPGVEFPLLSGVSAGAINVAHVANRTGTFLEASERLVESWSTLQADHVFVTGSSFQFLRSMLRSGSDANGPAGRALVDTAPLRAHLCRELATTDGELTGIADNLRSGRLRAVAVVATSYQTGQTVSWVQGDAIEGWERPNRVGIRTTLHVDHIMASTALPLLFPAVEVDGAWYGDGGIRLTAPLSPMIHMGADRILAVSTRYRRTRAEADVPLVQGYPSAAQVAGTLMKAIFLDMLDQDADTVRRLNDLLEAVPPHRRRGLRPVHLLMIRPSVDLARMAAGYEADLDGAIGLLTMGLGRGASASPDWTSMLLFDRAYVCDLVDVGYRDARARHDRIEAFLDPATDPAVLSRLAERDSAS